MTISDIIKYGLWAVGLIMLLSISLGSTTTVPQGYAGIYLVLGKANPTPLEPGFHGKLPFISNVVLTPTTQFKYDTGGVTFKSSDSQQVQTRIVVTLHQKLGSVVSIYGNVAQDVDSAAQVVVAPDVAGDAGIEFSKYTINELVTKRSELTSSLFTKIKADLDKQGFAVDNLNVTDFHFSDIYNNSIEQKMSAEQSKLTAQATLETQTVQANIKVVNAKAEADAAIAAATGEATAVTIKAKADAQAIDLKNEALAKVGPNYINYLQLTQWDGHWPTYYGVGGQPLIKLPAPASQQ
jgi:regulator of protease activity HflC (stomatin/prohibitin superfamily)